MSPGFRLRPSLSVLVAVRHVLELVEGVAGVQTPAFVERSSRPTRVVHRHGVSPGFRLRPSLSAVMARHRDADGGVSPGFRLRPSLSDRPRLPGPRRPTVSPGFRLRPSLSVARENLLPEEVLAVSPGFRLRPSLSASILRGSPCTRPAVSPGFRLRPSLSDRAISVLTGMISRCRRGSDSGLR